MKNKIKKYLGNENGMALAIVLALLAAGGLVLVPLLHHVYTGLNSEKIYRERMELNYAADAGLEDGIWRADNELIPLTAFDYESVYTYTLPETLNDKSVNVTVQQIWILDGLESDENGTTPARPPLSITAGVVSGEGEFEIRITYDTPDVELLIDRVAVWLPPAFSYVENSSSGMTEQEPDALKWNGGTALAWNFSPPVNFDDLPEPGAEEPIEGGMQPAVELPAARVLAFEVTPHGQAASGSYSWVRTTDPNNYLCWDTNLTIYHISAMAQDVHSGKTSRSEGYTYVSEGLPEGWLDVGETLMTGDYRAIGNTLMLDVNVDRRRETVLEESSATIANIPSDASVVLAYLYWSAWKDYDGTMEADKEVTFRIESASDMLRPNSAGNYTEIRPVGAVENYLCVDDTVSDDDATYVETGYPAEVLRPIAAGTYTQCDRYGDSANYLTVDEATIDNNATYIRTIYGATETDTYQLQDHTVGSATINSVTVHVWARADDYSSMAARTVIRTHGTDYFGTYTYFSPSSSYSEITTTYTSNPHTGGAWSWTEIDALEAGVRQYDLGSGGIRTTQVYVEVDYDVLADLELLTLRPNAAGDETGIPGMYPEGGPHYIRVKEATPDDLASYVYTEGTPISNWYNQDWSYRRLITIDHTKVADADNPSTEYADFPVLVYATGLNAAQADGGDIRFTASDGVTELPREIEYYNSGTLWAWVKTTLTKDSSDGSDDTFYMYYGSANATEPAPDSTYGSQNVWDSSFIGVWHLAETSGTIEDSTANTNHGTYSGSLWDPANKKIDGALGFDGYNDEVNMGNQYNSDLDMYGKSFTWECWYDTDGFASGTWSRLIAMRHDYNDYYQIVGDGDSNRIQFYVQKSGTVYAYGMNSPPSEWVHLAATFDNSTNEVFFYVNSVSKTDSVGNCGAGNDTYFRLGRRQDNAGVYDGEMDEVRVSSTVRSADWIATGFTNQNAPADFCVVSVEESQSSTLFDRDLYNLDNTNESGNINKVTVYFCFAGDAGGGTGYARAAIKTNGAVYTGNLQSQAGQTFTTASYEWALNPYTGLPWTWNEIDALQAGVELKGSVGVTGYCTQVYVNVEYGLSADIERDTYNYTDLSSLRGEVQSVTVYALSRGTSFGNTHAAETVIRTYGTDYSGDYTLLDTSFEELTTTYTTNPYTGLAWTLEEINALEAGIRHYDNGGGSVRTTQVYIRVAYDIMIDEVIIADNWWLMENQAPDYAYSCFKDVTDLVQTGAPTGNAIYWVGDVYGDTGSELSYAGWSLVLIYSSASEQGQQFFLYDQLTFAGTNASGNFLVEGFVAPSDASVTLTCFVGEGDDWYDGDSLQLNGTYLSDATNPQDDVWNGKSSGLSGELIDGVDIDTFDVSSPIINPGDTSANLTYTTAQDNWNLIYHILAFRTDHGILTPSGTGIFSWD